MASGRTSTNSVGMSSKNLRRCGTRSTRQSIRHVSFLQLFYSSAQLLCRRFCAQRPTGTSRGHRCHPFPPRYLPSFLLGKRLGIPTARRFASTFASSGSRTLHGWAKRVHFDSNFTLLTSLPTRSLKAYNNNACLVGTC